MFYSNLFSIFGVNSTMENEFYENISDLEFYESFGFLGSPNRDSRGAGRITRRAGLWNSSGHGRGHFVVKGPWHTRPHQGSGKEWPELMVEGRRLGFPNPNRPEMGSRPWWAFGTSSRAQ